MTCLISFKIYNSLIQLKIIEIHSETMPRAFNNKQVSSSFGNENSITTINTLFNYFSDCLPFKTSGH